MCPRCGGRCDAGPATLGCVWLGVAAAMAVVVVLALLFTASYTRFRSQSEPATVPKSPTMVGRRLGPAEPARRTGAVDETEARARRELERLYRRTGLGQAPGIGDEVRLRSGGSLSRSEYERYRSSVGGGPR